MNILNNERGLYRNTISCFIMPKFKKGTSNIEGQNIKCRLNDENIKFVKKEVKIKFCLFGSFYRFRIRKVMACKGCHLLNFIFIK